MEEKNEEIKIDSEELRILKEIKNYVRMFPKRFHLLLKQQEVLSKKFDRVELITQKLGSSCKESYENVKICINHLTSQLEQLNASFSEANGTCPSASFFG